MKEKGRARVRITREEAETMSAAEINESLDRVAEESSRIIDEMIAAGRGSERPSETAQRTDSLFLRYIQNWKAADILREEVILRYGPGAPRRLPTRGFGPRKGSR